MRLSRTPGFSQLVVQKNITWKRNLILASTGHFVNDFYNGFLAPLLPIIVVNLRLSFASAGLLISIFSISNSLLQPIAGFLADRTNRNYFVLFGPLMAGVFMSFIGLVHQYGTLLVILIMSGVGTALFHPQATAMVGNLENRRKGLSMSIFNTTGALGVSVGSAFIIPFTEFFGLSATLYTVLVVIAFFIYSCPYLMTKRENYAHSPILPLLKIVLKSKAALVISLHMIVVIRATLTMAFTGFIPLYFTSQGNSTFFSALGLAVFQFFLVIGMLIGGHVFDKIGPRKLLIISFLFILPLALLFVQLPSRWGLVSLALMGFFLASSTSVNILLGQRIAPNHASFMSALMMGLGWGIAGLLMTPFGALADRIGLTGALTSTAFLSIAGLILVYFLKLEDTADQSA